MIPRYPLQWPEGWKRTEAYRRTRAKFSQKLGNNYEGGYRPSKALTIADGTQRVLGELGRMGVRDADLVISSNLALRLDGLPKSGQNEPQDPGVAVYWRTRKGEMKVMAIDRYDRVADNLAAIAATLDAMRAIERHGGATILDRAFTGFDALPPPKSWREVLGVPKDCSMGDVKDAFRKLAMMNHPDNGGSHDAMAEINRAYEAAVKELG